jgi:L-threonylcarbamoyladenylate synthase
MTDIADIITLLQTGGTLLYPTDTVWGLGCDALNPAAVKRIFEIKERSETKSLIVLVDSLEMLQSYVPHIGGKLLRLHEFHSRPLTVIYPNSSLPAHLKAEDGSVAIRIVKDVFCQNIIKGLGQPIVSTSANISGAATPRFYAEISPKIIAKTDYVSTYRQKDHTETAPSTIIRLDEKDEIIVLRP